MIFYLLAFFHNFFSSLLNSTCNNFSLSPFSLVQLSFPLYTSFGSRLNLKSWLLSSVRRGRKKYLCKQESERVIKREWWWCKWWRWMERKMWHNEWAKGKEFWIIWKKIGKESWKKKRREMLEKSFQFLNSTIHFNPKQLRRVFQNITIRIQTQYLQSVGKKWKLLGRKEKVEKNQRKRSRKAGGRRERESKKEGERGGGGREREALTLMTLLCSHPFLLSIYFCFSLYFHSLSIFSLLFLSKSISFNLFLK